MADLEAVIDDIETLDEGVRDFYTKDEESGVYKLNVKESKGYVLENVEALKSTLTKVRREAKDYEKKYTEVSKKYAGIDLEEYNDIKSKYEELSKIDPNKEADRLLQEKLEAETKKIEKRLTKQWESKIDTEYKPYVDKYSKVESQLRKQLVENAAVSAIVAEKGDVDLLRPHLESRIKFEMNDQGEFEKYIIDTDGEPLYNNKGEKMSEQEFVATVLKGKFPGAFKSDAKSGGGTTTQDKKGGGEEKSLMDIFKSARPGQRLI